MAERHRSAIGLSSYHHHERHHHLFAQGITAAIQSWSQFKVKTGVLKVFRLQ